MRITRNWLVLGVLAATLVAVGLALYFGTSWVVAWFTHLETPMAVTVRTIDSRRIMVLPPRVRSRGAAHPPANLRADRGRGLRTG